MNVFFVNQKAPTVIHSILSIISITSMNTSYETLMAHCLQDPIFAALYRNEMMWGDADSNEHIHPINSGMQDAVKQALGNITLKKFFPLLFNEPACTNTIKTIIVRNLSRSLSVEELRGIFEVHGIIHDVYLPKNMDRSSPYFGTMKGFALIKYADPSASWTALTMNGTSLYGKNITVELAKVDRD